MPTKRKNPGADQQMSVIKELGSKRLLQYIPGADRIHAIELIRKAYIHKRFAADNQNDNSASAWRHQGPHHGRHHRIQRGGQFDFQPGLHRRQHHRLHHWLHLCSDIIYIPLG
jgi:hypothetical protein